ncbi:MAG: hypothetical protein ACRDK5_01355 [Solirubrobacterales bacterium]
MAFMLTRIHVDDYDTWKEAFDSDTPGARKSAKGYRILRGVEDPNEVFISVEFPSSVEAKEGRQRLIDAGVLERVNVKSGPTLAEQAEAVGS